MSIRGALLFVGITVKVATVLLGHPCLIFALEALLKPAAAALLSVVGA
ncbi:MAG TPA: hypothetical protein VN087_15480 [Verrucomicrobiae bacterium]|jgi:hypothetical protein|nr:hypothetical protein [Verrucomicrobiae bacterium]